MNSTNTQARMEDVAKRAKVSTMTVSRFLRDPTKVSKDTQRRIERAVKDVGYVPNELAGSLRNANGSKLVAAIMPSLRNSLFTATTQGLSDGLRGGGVNLMIGDCHYSPEEESDLISAFLGLRPWGIVLHDSIRSPHARRILLKSGIPIVQVGDLTNRPLDMVVSYSNRAAAEAMTHHLIQNNYSNVAFASLPIALTPRAAARLEGYKAALKAAKRSYNPELVIEVEGGFASGAEALIRLLRAGADAIFFAGDVLAVGAALECQRRGWTVPDKVAIASFDDHDMASGFAPRLTALRIPRYEIGKRAAKLILERHAGVKAESQAVNDMGFKLLARESTAPRRK